MGELFENIDEKRIYKFVKKELKEAIKVIVESESKKIFR